MYQIVEIYPVHCQITDGLIGSKAKARPMAYRSEALAHKLAGRLHDADYEGCGDSSFVVVKYGESAFARSNAARLRYQADDAAEMPF